MQSKRTLLYIPGLGDDVIGQRQSRYLSWWGKLHRVTVIFFDPEWHKPEPYEKKLQRLEQTVDTADLDQLTIVGVSAGGSLAIQLASSLSTFKRVITVCGKLRGARSIGKNYTDRTPALYDSVAASEKVIINNKVPVEKVVCYRSLYDPIVPLVDSIIEGARNKRIPMLGHTPAIVLFLACYLPRK